VRLVAGSGRLGVCGPDRASHHRLVFCCVRRRRHGREGTRSAHAADPRPAGHGVLPRGRDAVRAMGQVHGVLPTVRMTLRHWCRRRGGRADAALGGAAVVANRCMGFCRGSDVRAAAGRAGMAAAFRRIAFSLVVMSSLSGSEVRRAGKARIWNHRCTPMHTDGTGATDPARLARALAAIAAVNGRAGSGPSEWFSRADRADRENFCRLPAKLRRCPMRCQSEGHSHTCKSRDRRRYVVAAGIGGARRRQEGDGRRRRESPVNIVRRI
jgi:hypothetical protein